ncbi:MAG: glycosyltransferase family 39 protein, partial [bacterium]
MFHDEAYYWMYSRNLAWGYFDHPPMIALLVKAGYLIIPNELGVRLFALLMNTATIFIIEKIINPRDLKLYYALISSIILIHYGGSLAIPDIPLLFFTASFFYLYRQYLKKPSLLIMLLLGLNAGLLLLSKYHGVLVIVFTLASNLSLLRRKETWLAGLIAFLVFLPHLLWQFEHNFPTLGYQLMDREKTRFDYTYVLEFIFTQPLVYGPIVGVILLYFAFLHKPADLFEKGLKLNLYGVFILFFLFTFRGKVEAHWTDVAFVPLVYLGYLGIRRSEKIKRFILISFPVSLTLILAARLFLMVNYLPSSMNVKTEFHGWDAWAEQLKTKSGGKPMVFLNSYQNAAKYEFYSKVTSISLNDERGRKNQYDIWDSERKLQGLPVYYSPGYYLPGTDSIFTKAGLFFGVSIPDFRTYPDISME